MAETVVLDPAAVATGRTALDITSWIKAPDGIDWGDAEIQAYLADMAVGSRPVDYRLPNRQVSIPIVLQAMGATTFATIRSSLQRKVALLQHEGGWLSRTTDQGTVYADIVNATLHLGGSAYQAYRGYDLDATLTLELVPDFYGDLITLDTLTSSPAGILNAVLKSGGSTAVIAGDHPGRVTITVTETSTQEQHGLLWGFRSRYYDSAASAALYYDATALKTLNGAVSASGVVTSPALVTDVWTAFIDVSLTTPAQLTHQGNYRMWARCSAGSTANNPTLRLTWAMGSLANPQSNTPQVVPAGTGFWMIDLGVIDLRRLIGGPEWFGVIEAQGASNGETVQVDAVYFQPLEESAGVLLASPAAPISALSWSAGKPTSLVDDATVGNVAWNITGLLATVSLAAVTDTSHYVKLTGWGFVIPAGATVTGVKFTANFVALSGTGKTARMRLIKGGAIQATEMSAGGHWINSVLSWGGPASLWGAALLPADVNAATFGVAVSLGSYKFPTSGLQGLYIDPRMTLTVYYTLGTGWSVSSDAVMYASRSVTLDTIGMSRADSTGAFKGPVSIVEGDLPRIPPSGVDNRSVELFLKQSRGDFDIDQPDAGLDNVSAVVKYRPSYLFVP